MATFRYLCIAGTGSRFHDWCHQAESPFRKEMVRRGGEPILMPGGFFPYTWSGALGGTFWTGDGVWFDEADRVHELLRHYDVHERIIFAHSHGGQIPIILAANGFKLGSLNTISTPHRPNLRPQDAVKNIGYWQHVYDPKRDWISTTPRRLAARLGLGGLGGGDSFGDRAFRYPGVENIEVEGSRHSRIFKEDFHKMGPILDRAIAKGVKHG